MNERSMLPGPSVDDARRGAWIRSAPWAAAPLLCVCLTTALPAQTIVVPSTRPSPIPLAMSRVSDRSIAVSLAGGAQPGVTKVELRNLGDQTLTSVDVDTMAPGSTFVLPSPWNGELRIMRPGAGGIPATSAFVAVVVEPVLPDAGGGPHRILYGPNGRSSVRFSANGTPPHGTQVFITSPAISMQPSPARLVGDPVEIGFMPSLPRQTTGVVGLTPWTPPRRGRLVVSVFDPPTRRWSVLPSRAGRDGTVYATGPLPGVYALTVTQ